MENSTNEPACFFDKLFSYIKDLERKEFKFIFTGEFVSFCYKDSLSAMIMYYLLFHTKKPKKSNKMYKFIEPCKNKYYRKGDSWCELTGSTANRVIYCLDKLCVKLKHEKDETPHNKMVERFIIGKRTFYRINEENTLNHLKDWLIEQDLEKLRLKSGFVHKNKTKIEKRVKKDGK